MPCIKSLLADYKAAGGVCAGSQNYGEYPVSDIPCIAGGGFILQGLCSAATESLLLERDCRTYVWNNKEEVFWTMYQGLVRSMCTTLTWYAFVPWEVSLFGDEMRSLEPPLLNSEISRLLPIT